MSSAPEAQVGGTKSKYQCHVCEKKFDSLYILNYPFSQVHDER